MTYYILHGYESEPDLVVKLDGNNAFVDVFKIDEGELKKYSMTLAPEHIEQIKHSKGKKEEQLELYNVVNHKCLTIEMKNEQNKKLGNPLIDTQSDEIPPYIFDELNAEKKEIPEIFKQVDIEATKKCVAVLLTFMIATLFINYNENLSSLVSNLLGGFSETTQFAISLASASAIVFGSVYAIKRDAIKKQNKLVDRYMQIENQMENIIKKVEEKQKESSTKGQIAQLKSLKQELLDMLEKDKQSQQILQTSDMYIASQSELLKYAQIPVTNPKEWIQEEKCPVSHAPVKKLGEKGRRLYVTGTRRP